VKRRVGLILLLLVAGAIVNVAVAWGCVLLHQDSETGPWQSYPLGDDRTWEVHINRRIGVERVASFCATYNVFRIHSTPKPTTTPKRPLPALPNWTGLKREPPAQIDRLDAAGWPTLAVAARLELASVTSGYRSRPPIGGVAVMVGSRKADHPFFSDSVTLPLHPIWPGFAINTLFYALGFWLLFTAPFALRRRRRVKRGLCPACAYPVGDSEVCTECGSPHTVKPKEMAA
jgi:hypothetical protein